MKYAFKLLRFLRKFWLYRILRKQTRGVRVILRNENRILLIKHPYDDFWVFPGGGISRRETAMVAGMREVLEETGYSIVGEMKLLGEYMNNSGGKDDVVTVFVADKLEKYGGRQKLLDKIEIQKCQWFEIDDLPKISEATEKRLLEFKSNLYHQHKQIWN